MITNNTYSRSMALGYRIKTRLFFQLMKVRLSLLVVFSGAFGYLLALNSQMNWISFFALVLGSFMVTAAANTINQVIEKDLDKLMARTRNRPLPTGALTVSEAVVFATLLTMVGTVLLAVFVNVLTATLALFSLILYAFVYTPLKQSTSLSVLVGAFPGAMPPLIGWVAWHGSITVEALIIFGIQFIWQFPHFWAIAWLGHEDYHRAGFKMLPSKYGRDAKSAVQIMLYTLFLLPLGILPAHYGITGIASAFIATIAGVLFLVQSFPLIKHGNDKAALRIMFASFIYLPVVQLALLFDKI